MLIPPRPHSASNWLLLSERVDYLGTSSHNDDDDNAASDIDAYGESYFTRTPS